ncbi:MAG: hypothetical protein ACP5XB_21250 [Isosphaeraceae bacterium]
MKPADLKRAVLASEIPFRLELKRDDWPLVCDGPNWSISPSGEFFTHLGYEASITVRAEDVRRVVPAGSPAPGPNGGE